MAGKLFIKGLNTKLTLQLGVGSDTRNIVLRCMEWELEEDVTEIADGECGEDRDTLDIVTNFYRVMLNLQLSDLKILEAVLEETRQRDLKVQQVESAVGLLISPNDGTRKSYLCQEFTRGAWKLSGSNRAERVKFNFPGRCRYVKPIQTL